MKILFFLVNMFLLNFINANVLSYGPEEYLKSNVNTNLLEKRVEQNDYFKLMTQKQFYINNMRSKKNFGIKLFYEIIELDDGRLVYVPHDVNRNHYFIG